MNMRTLGALALNEGSLREVLSEPLRGALFVTLLLAILLSLGLRGPSSLRIGQYLGKSHLTRKALISHAFNGFSPTG